ncbi:hypothetical protein C6A28_09895, partial [Streptococcus anginosus]
SFAGLLGILVNGVRVWQVLMITLMYLMMSIIGTRIVDVQWITAPVMAAGKMFILKNGVMKRKLLSSAER